MTTDDSIQRFGLVPAVAALPEIRGLLATEAEAERGGREREEDLALLCCVQLFARGLLEDVPRIWQAKRSGMDLGITIDVRPSAGPVWRRRSSSCSCSPVLMPPPPSRIFAAFRPAGTSHRRATSRATGHTSASSDPEESVSPDLAPERQFLLSGLRLLLALR